MGQELLGRQGYEVDTAGDGREALTALRQKSYDLLITDHNMPRLTGVEVVSQARQGGIHVPVVMTSEFAHSSQLAEIAESIVAIIPKPFAVSELLEAVKLILRRDHGPEPSEVALNSIVKTLSSEQSHHHWGINDQEDIWQK